MRYYVAYVQLNRRLCENTKKSIKCLNNEVVYLLLFYFQA